MALLYLVRHGESPVNVTRTFSYRKVDPGLTELGQDQARAVARAFVDKPIARIFTGPLQRAQQTARYIAQATGAPLESTRRCASWTSARSKVAPTRPVWDIHDEILRAWRRGNPDATFPDGENYHQVHARITGFLDRLATDFPDQDLVAVGHGGIFCCVLPQVCDIPLGDGEWLTLGNTAVSTFRRGQPLTCEQWNGQAHLT